MSKMQDIPSRTSASTLRSDVDEPMLDSPDLASHDLVPRHSSSPRSPLFSPRLSCCSIGSPIHPPRLPVSSLLIDTAPEEAPYSPTSCVFDLASPLAPSQDNRDFDRLNFMYHRCDLIIYCPDAPLYAHQSVLKLASKTLSLFVYDAVRLFNKSSATVFLPTIHLGRSSRSVRTMLEWLYPHTSMNVGDFEVLSEGLAIAETYGLDTMYETLRSMMRQPGSRVNMKLDPIAAFGVAMKHKMVNEAEDAARMSVGKLDFRKQGDGGVLHELNERGVSLEHGFVLMQKQFAWEGALGDILLGTRTSGWGGESILPTSEERSLIMCDECRPAAGDVLTMWGNRRLRGRMELVEWQAVWVDHLYTKLLYTPLEECAYMFRPDCLLWSWNETCEQCMCRSMKNLDTVTAWMDRVWNLLQAACTGVFRCRDI